MKNWLKDLIDARFDKCDKNIYLHLSKHQSLYELRSLYAIGPRQTGATYNIAEIFDVDRDIYFGNNPEMVKMFKKQVGSSNILYSYLNQRSHDNLIGRCKNIRYVFIDISCAQIYDTSVKEKIDKFIKFCEFLPHDNKKYIFT